MDAYVRFPKYVARQRISDLAHLRGRQRKGNFKNTERANN